MSAKYELHVTGQFKRDLKRCKKRGLPLNELWVVIEKLLKGETLDEKYRAHILTGDRKGQWECRLLIWERREQELILIMLNTGRHADVFSKKRKK